MFFTFFTLSVVSFILVLLISESNLSLFYLCAGCHQNLFYMASLLQSQMCGAMEWCCGKSIVLDFRFVSF